MPTPTRATILEELLGAYRDALDVAERARPVVAPRRSRRRILRVLRRPWPTWFLRLLVRGHVERHVQHLVRSYATLALRRPADEGVATERRLVATFRESLPPVRRHGARVAAVLAVLLLAQLEAYWVGKAGTDAALRGSAVLESLSTLTKLDTQNVGEALATIYKAGPRALALASFLLVAAAYVVLRPVSPAFRLKRMVLHHRLQPGDGFRGAITAGAGTRSGGIYELEARLARELGVRTPRELPLDLCTSSLIPYLVALIGVLAWWGATTGSDQIYGAAFVGTALLRTMHLLWIWRRRSRVWRSSHAAAPGPAAPVPTWRTVPATAPYLST